MIRRIISTAVFLGFFPCISLAHGTIIADTVKFICSELLGRPTNNSITINLCADKDLDVYVQYGTQKTVYTNQTSTSPYTNNVPFNIIINNLQPGTTYFYRVRYRITGTANFLARVERSFKTAKMKGTQFTFAIEADPHLDSNTNPDLYKLTLANILNNNPDFLLDLGDTFMSEKIQNKTQDSITIRHLLLRSYFDLVCHSAPLYLVSGNHEGECGWELNGTANSLAVMASNTRTKYYPNPLPDDFYSGNNTSEQFVGRRQNYNSWEWGNALFVVLDPYWYTQKKPDDKTVNNWSWTLGRDQYLWFKNALEMSSAKFKFVFAHQILGGKDSQGRGGGDYAQYYEMGGLNSDNTWGFNDQRKGWELPLHQLMARNHVNIFFHGHDHFYARQEKDGIVYQLVPQPGYLGNNSGNQAVNYGYLTGKTLPSSGYLKVTVSDTTATVDYIKSYLPAMETNQKKNGTVEYSYTISTNDQATEVGNHKRLPLASKLFQNYPNPFNPETVISYSLAEGGRVQLKLYDALGRERAILIDQVQQPGSYDVPFHYQKYSLPSGIYFYRITSGRYSKVMKMVCLK